MADKKLERVVCLDDGFAGSDQLKPNAGTWRRGARHVASH